MINISSGNWNNFLIQLGTFNLDRFEFIMEPQSRAGNTAFHEVRGINVSPKFPKFREETLYGAARTVLIEPLQLEQFVEKHLENRDDHSGEEDDDW